MARQATPSGRRQRGQARLPSYWAGRIFRQLLRVYIQKARPTGFASELARVEQRHVAILAVRRSWYGERGNPGLAFPLRPSLDRQWARPLGDQVYWLDDCGWQTMRDYPKGEEAEYLQDVEELAKRWGLHAPWGAVALHNILAAAGARLFGSAEPSDDDLTLQPGLMAWRQVARDSHPTVQKADLMAMAGAMVEGVWNVTDPWENVEKELLSALRSARDALRTVVNSRGLVRIQDSRQEFDKHVYWLFLRICPQQPLGRPLGWSAIARQEGVTLETVRDAVRPLAEELGLTLQQLPRGRPPGSTPIPDRKSGGT